LCLLENDWDGAAEVIEALCPADLFSELEPITQEALLPQLEVENAADILEKLEDPEAAKLAQGLPAAVLALIADEMEPDDAANLLDDLPDLYVADVLAKMESAEEICPLMPYPDNTAGGLMTTEFITLKREMTVAQALEEVRQWDPDSDVVYYLFVVDGDQILRGVVLLRQLLFVDPTKRVEDVMDPDVISVPTDADQEKCAQIISRYDLFALPVVDERERLQGIVTVDDVVDVMVDEASEDIHRIGASEPLEQLYLSASTFTLARKQVVWLLLLFVAETLTGTVLRHFEYELSAVVALAFFIPLLIGTGGNAGSQAATTVIRSMTLGEVRFQDLWKVLRKEIILAIILGVTIASVGYLRSLTWGNTPAFALTVAASIMAIILWANIVGSIVPNLAQRIGIDPTVLSAPFVTTLVYGTGLFIYFTIANLILGI
jgi:magnesium transporter